MTISLFNQDAYLNSAKANIVAVAENSVAVDQTIFYPLGGGQLGDTGTLRFNDETYNIIDTIWGEGIQILHLLDKPLPSEAVSENVLLSLDWQRRFNLMKMHTCLHLICSMFDFPIVGARVAPLKGHLDYFTDGEAIDKLASDEILQNIISQNLNISTEKVPEAEFQNFMENRHLIGGMPPVKNGVVRFVRIGEVDNPIDYQPCGGTHVRNTSEIKNLHIATIKSKGKGIRRLNVKLVEA
ncbi:MAG: alanyl-tRNA editing protein [Hyphomicrobiales bacterium]